jgi:hypothetical protein
LFQSCYKVEELGPARLRYRRIEKRTQKIFSGFVIGLGVVLALWLLLAAISLIYHEHKKTLLSYTSLTLIYWTQILTFGLLTIVGFGVSLNLQLAMKKFHNYEYHRHKWKIGIISMFYLTILVYELYLVWVEATSQGQKDLNAWDGALSEVQSQQQISTAALINYFVSHEWLLYMFSIFEFLPQIIYFIIVMNSNPHDCF